MHKKIFLKENLQNFDAHIFTFLVAPFASKLVNYSRHSEYDSESLNIWKIRNRRQFPSIAAICRLSNIFQRLTLPRVIDQFGRKRCQKKREDVEDKLIKEFFQKYFDEHERSAVKTSFSTYVCYAPDGCFWFLTKCI